jgi:hypothetical protein
MNISLLEPPKLTAVIDSISAYNAFNISCNGYTDGAIFLSVSGGIGNYTYLWSNGSGTKDITGIGAGLYSVNITDQNGCTIGVSATLVEPVPMVASYNAIDPSCNGMTDGSITLLPGGGLSPYIYNWSNGATTSSNLNLAAGSYSDGY